MTFDATTTESADEKSVITPNERKLFTQLARHSHRIITREQRPEGAYPAAPTFSAYTGYAWLRDSSFIAEGVSRYGDTESADRFHSWADRVLVARAAQVAAIVAAAERGEALSQTRMLPTRFTYLGADGSEPWWDFQTDGYGMWLWSAVTHSHRHGADLERWRTGLELATDYINAVWDRPCYDWWEEHAEHRHVSTLGALYGGLIAIAESSLLDSARTDRAIETAARIRSLVAAEGVVDGHLTKWLGTDVVDGSLPACILPFGLVDVGDTLAAGTLAAVSRDLDVDGGVHRFSADVFYGGGKWVLLSALLGWNAAARGDLGAAMRHLRWIAAQADARGDLPEQVPGHLLHPQSRPEWIARWGDVATPLLWSHGMYLILADELGLAREDGDTAT